VRAGARCFVTFPEGKRAANEAEAIEQMSGMELVPQLKQD